MQGLIHALLQFSRVTSKPRQFSHLDLSESTRELPDDISVEIEAAGAKVAVGRCQRSARTHCRCVNGFKVCERLDGRVEYAGAGIGPALCIGLALCHKIAGPP